MFHFLSAGITYNMYICGFSLLACGSCSLLSKSSCILKARTADTLLKGDALSQSCSAASSHCRSTPVVFEIALVLVDKIGGYVPCML